MPDVVTPRRALLSVSDKAGLIPFATALAERGVELISTGGTARGLREAGLAVREVAELTGMPEAMEGRVKTLHPAVHGGLLALRDRHAGDMAALGAEEIDLAVVNLYPFEAALARGAGPAEMVETIDVGGPAMIRAAAKNHAWVAVATDPEDYGAVLADLDAHGGTRLATRRALAARAFARTAAYDAAIAGWMEEDAAPRDRTFGGRAIQALRYGENPHQTAALHAAGAPRPGVAGAVQHQGKPLSYNNIADADAAIEAVAEIAWTDAPDVGGAGREGAAAGTPADAEDRDGRAAGAAAGAVAADPGTGAPGGDAASPRTPGGTARAGGASGAARVASDARPACVIVKHANPCGAALGETAADAYARAFEGDPESAFGGVVALSVPLDEAAARAIVGVFAEVVIAPSATGAALAALAAKPNLRVLSTGALPDPGAGGPTFRSVAGGMLVQGRDSGRVGRGDLRIVTRRAPTEAEVEDMLLAWRVAKHVRSNAIVLARGGATVGVGPGQTSRVGAVRIAVDRAGERAAGAALASDAFFPFADGLEAAAEAGVRAVIQPGGSVRDAEVVAAADEAGVAMAFTGQRHFRH